MNLHSAHIKLEEKIFQYVLEGKYFSGFWKIAPIPLVRLMQCNSHHHNYQITLPQ